MIDWQNRILTNVKIQLGDKCPFVVSTSSKVKSTFPACCVTVTGGPEMEADLDADEDENAINCGVSVDIYSKVSAEDARKLLGIADKAMHKMGFQRAMGPSQIENPMSPDIFRYDARYTRVIGFNDEIKKFEIETPNP